MRKTFMNSVPATAALVLFAMGCSAGAASSSMESEQTAGKDVADTSCRVVLRYAGQSGISGGETFVDPSTRKNWRRYRVVADVDSRLIQAGGVPMLRYRAVLEGRAVGGVFPGRWVDVQAINPKDNLGDPALINVGAGLTALHGGQIVPKGFTRVAFATTTDTIAAGDDLSPTIEMIPFIHQPAGAGKNIWDHNRNGGPFGVYRLDSSSQFVVTDDLRVCPAPPP